MAVGSFGVLSLVPPLTAIAIIVLAWSISLAASKVGTAAYVVDVMVGSGVPAGVLPIIVFLAAMFVSFTTGTSWGTIGILTPIAVPLGYEFAGPEMLPVLRGVLFGGAIWGDHSSPITDTTVMSSIFARSDHIDHVNRQIPLALSAAGATVVALVLYAVAIKSILVLPLSTVLTVVGVYGLNKFDASQKNRPEVLPSRARIAEYQDLAERIEAGTVDPTRLRRPRVAERDGLARVGNRSDLHRRRVPLRESRLTPVLSRRGVSPFAFPSTSLSVARPSPGSFDTGENPTRSPRASRY